MFLSQFGRAPFQSLAGSSSDQGRVNAGPLDEVDALTVVDVERLGLRAVPMGNQTPIRQHAVHIQDEQLNSFQS